MTQDFSLHTHTNQFDGKNTVAEMVCAAKKAGLTTIGISNHFIVHPWVKQSHFYPYAVRGGYQNNYHDTIASAICQFQKNYEEINRIAAQSDIRILRGLEVDFFPRLKWRLEFERALKILQPDYLIGACHLIEYQGCLCNVHDISHASRAHRIQMMKKYWENIGYAASSGLFTFMAHLDLPKKVGIAHATDWGRATDNALDIIADKKTPVEINTGGLDQCGTVYPSSDILQRLALADVPVIISDDAHHISQIRRHFDTAETLIASHDIKNRLSLQKILDFSTKNR